MGRPITIFQINLKHTNAFFEVSGCTWSNLD